MATTWAGTALNQGVTGAAFANRFPVFNPVGQTTKCMTKGRVVSHGGEINFSFPALSNKSSGQLVVKSDITTVMVISTTSTAGGGCGQTGDQTVYQNAQGTIVYTNSSLTTTFTGTGNYYRVGAGGGEGYSIQISSVGVIGATYAC